MRRDNTQVKELVLEEPSGLDYSRLPTQVTPFEGDIDNFEPFGVGYVEIHDEVKVETRLTTANLDELQIGMEMELSFVPLYQDSDGNDVITFAFAPCEA